MTISPGGFPSGTERITAGRTTIGQFFAGIGLLGRGLGMYSRSPRLVALGLIPAVITGVLYLAALITLLVYISDIAGWLTPFTRDWSTSQREIAEFVVAVSILGLAGLFGVLTYTALTLLVGDPFYEKISRTVEDRFGGVPDEIEVRWWRALGRSLADTARLVALSLLIGVPLFLVGLIPVVGQVVAPVTGALVGGWLLAVELVGVAFTRRGKRLADRRRVLRAHRPLALGFGVSVFLCFLVPLGAVLVMPAAVAGGTLLARRVLGLPV